MNCKKCGAKIALGERFCGECGSAIEETTSVSNSMNNHKTTFGEAIKKLFSRAVDFSGRSTAREYWFAMLFNILFYLFTVIIEILIILTSRFSVIAIIISFVVTLIYTLIILIPSLSLMIRRLHDIGKSGAYIFIQLIPLAGSIILLVLLCGKSDGNNQWGANQPYDIYHINKCTICGTTIKKGSPFCENCGAKTQKTGNPVLRTVLTVYILSLMLVFIGTMLSFNVLTQSVSSTFSSTSRSSKNTASSYYNSNSQNSNRYSSNSSSRSDTSNRSSSSSYSSNSKPSSSSVSSKAGSSSNKSYESNIQNINNIKATIKQTNGNICSYSTSYVCENGKAETVRTGLQGGWHVTAKRKCNSHGLTWYEIWDTDDNDYYGWIDSNYLVLDKQQ